MFLLTVWNWIFSLTLTQWGIISALEYCCLPSGVSRLSGAPLKTLLKRNALLNDNLVYYSLDCIVSCLHKRGAWHLWPILLLKCSMLQCWLCLIGLLPKVNMSSLRLLPWLITVMCLVFLFAIDSLDHLIAFQFRPFVWSTLSHCAHIMVLKVMFEKRLGMTYFP